MYDSGNSVEIDLKIIRTLRSSLLVFIVIFNKFSSICHRCWERKLMPIDTQTFERFNAKMLIYFIEFAPSQSQWLLNSVICMMQLSCFILIENSFRKTKSVQIGISINLWCQSHNGANLNN